MTNYLTTLIRRADSNPKIKRIKEIVNLVSHSFPSSSGLVLKFSVLKQFIPLAFITFNFLLFSFEKSYAQVTRPSDIKPSIYDPLLISGPLDSMKSQLLSNLLTMNSASAKTLEFPMFPRVWFEKNIQTVRTSNTALSTPSLFVSMGAKVSVEFKYTLKSSFILVAHINEENEFNEKNPSQSLIYIKDQDKAEGNGLIKLDKTTLKAYPNVKPDSPMVGICTYEASLVITKGQSLNFNIAGILSETVERSKLETVSYSMFSNLFQISEDVSLSSYLKDKCTELYGKNHEKKVEDDFSKAILELLLNSNPESDCTPLAKDEKSLPEGDPSCKEWFTQFHRTVQKRSVPRCRLQNSGSFKCQLRSLENISCPLYIDRNTGKYSPTYDRNFYKIRATAIPALTGGFINNPCDEASGLSCKMETEPKLVRGIPLFEGTARCKR